MKKLFLMLMTSAVALGLVSCSSTGSQNPYITFKSGENFSVCADNPGWTGTVEFSKDLRTWKEWDGTSAGAQLSQDGSYYLYFRGKGNTKISGSTGNRWQIIDGTAGCCGNIMSLLDYENPDEAEMSDSCFREMFYGCENLTSAPELPAETLADSCYCGMFYGCKNLTSAPDLPAETLADSCYCGMFYGCENITSAPELPASELAENCYNMMFGRTGLKIYREGELEGISGTLFLTLPSELPEGSVTAMFTGTGGKSTGTPSAGGRYYWYN